MTGLPHIRQLCAKLLEESDTEKVELICAALRAALDEHVNSAKSSPQPSETT
jgi:hypothetical protein